MIRVGSRRFLFCRLEFALKRLFFLEEVPVATSAAFVTRKKVWFCAIICYMTLACSAENSGRVNTTVDYSKTGLDASVASGADGTAVETGGTGGPSDVTTGGIDAGDNSKKLPEASAREAEVCAQQQIQLIHKTPLVMFVVDRSGSTADPYGNSDPDAGPVISRWDALHEAIMDPTNGVVKTTQSEILIGITLYDGGPLLSLMECFRNRDAPGCSDIDFQNPTANCPRLVTVSPEKNNFDAIASQYTSENAGPDGTTPTALALQNAYQEIESYMSSGLDTKTQFSPVVILVTDGEPNGCDVTMDPNTGTVAPDYQGPVDQVTAASEKGIKTFVVGIDTSTAGSPPEVGPHLDELAQLGGGSDKAFLPTNKDELSKILINLIEQSGCDIAVEGEIVEGYEDKGTVILNGAPLIYGDPNGYRVTNLNQITLLGSACELFSKDEDVVLEASFPCEAIVLL